MVNRVQNRKRGSLGGNGERMHTWYLLIFACDRSTAGFETVSAGGIGPENPAAAAEINDRIIISEGLKPELGKIDNTQILNW